MGGASALRVIPVGSVAKRKRLPRISNASSVPGLQAVNWHPVAQTADGHTIVVTVHVSAERIIGVVGVTVTETDESVSIDVFGQTDPSNLARTLASVYSDFLIDLDRPLGERRLHRSE